MHNFAGTVFGEKLHDEGHQLAAFAKVVWGIMGVISLDCMPISL